MKRHPQIKGGEAHRFRAEADKLLNAPESNAAQK
jgi:hypothetical protein